MPKHPQRYFLLGPTASGKTSVSLALAEKLNAEILSLDSMLVYRGMDIGTAKPSAEERAPVPHHLIDVVEPSEEFSVKQYLDATAKVEAELQARGKAALYVGGTTMWFKALMFGLLEVPQASITIRNDIQAALDRGEAKALREELQVVDPDAFERIHENDTRRLQRALETYRQTGKALSEWQSQWQAGRDLTDPVALLEWPREVLRERVVKRFAQMLDAGFLEEVKSIRDGVGFGRTAAKAIGYRQILDHLEGQCTLEEALQKGITKTHVLIRRQMTWLRSFPGILKVPMEEGVEASVVAGNLATQFAAK
ncbi:MAG: tRNA (adenosine(37)-N6)-dimethylallyltransferase MiaA [Planctomycetota bacterium]|nr:tRNA (adenosine(37)-N6)-dimethylallyltransferase MiaA [Planctomycetota bacterium]MDA1114365.1 tRNA (adenosine(37)-N6)-dimethylallyltransferase MiaA [Planctomycetota bacterium]